VPKTKKIPDYFDICIFTENYHKIALKIRVALAKHLYFSIVFLQNLIDTVRENVT
jgi:hypothetical protein